MKLQCVFPLEFRTETKSEKTWSISRGSCLKEGCCWLVDGGEVPPAKLKIVDEFRSYDGSVVA